MSVDTIPTTENYRGVGIHDCQSFERIKNVVRPAIDAVIAMSDLAALIEYAAYTARPPEARLLAAAKAEAIFQIAVDERRERPNISLSKLHALVAGLNSLRWRSPSHYCSLLDGGVPPGEPGPDRRETPLDKGAR